MMPERNVFFTCEECAEKLYPRKGKFINQEIQLASHVKICINDEGYKEHLWIEVIEVLENTVRGKIVNYPVIVRVVFGQKITFNLSEIEDVIFR